MTMFSCPHCNVASFSAARKLMMGSAIPVRCHACHASVAMPGWATFAMVSNFAVSAVIVGNVEPISRSLVATVLSALALSSPWFVIWVFCVPLERR